MPLKMRILDPRGQEISLAGAYTITSLAGGDGTGPRFQISTEFQPRDIIGTKEFGRIEVSVVSPSTNGGYIDVRYMALEALD